MNRTAGDLPLTVLKMRVPAEQNTAIFTSACTHARTLVRTHTNKRPQNTKTRDTHTHALHVDIDVEQHTNTCPLSVRGLGWRQSDGKRLSVNKTKIDIPEQNPEATPSALAFQIYKLREIQLHMIYTYRNWILKTKYFSKEQEKTIQFTMVLLWRQNHVSTHSLALPSPERNKWENKIHS